MLARLTNTARILPAAAIIAKRTAAPRTTHIASLLTQGQTFAQTLAAMTQQNPFIQQTKTFASKARPNPQAINTRINDLQDKMAKHTVEAGNCALIIVSLLFHAGISEPFKEKNPDKLYISQEDLSELSKEGAPERELILGLTELTNTMPSTETDNMNWEYSNLLDFNSKLTELYMKGTFKRCKIRPQEEKNEKFNELVRSLQKDITKITAFDLELIEIQYAKTTRTV